jgi:hypothetical membrane protein
MARRGFWFLGYVAPVFFAGAIIVLGALKPGYSHVFNTISELGEAGAVTAQAASLVFTVTGIMITVFGLGLHLRLRQGDRRVWSGVLVMLYGLLDFVGSGVFPVEAGGAATSLVSTIHVYATLMGEFAAVGMPIWFLNDTEGAGGGDIHRRFSRVVFWLSLPLIVFLGYCIMGHTPGVVDTPIGLAQRLLVGLFLVWIMVTANRLKE